MRPSVLSLECNRAATLPILLLCLLLAAAANAERDFNVNDSQVPVIEPKEAPAYKQEPYVTELMRCQQAQPEIVLSLLLRKQDWSELSVAKRMHVQAKLAKFFAIPKEFITLDSVTKRELGNMHKLAMRKGGKGLKHVDTANRRLGRASFMIGCGSSYFSMGEPIAKQIGHQIKDGTIGALTEENFGLWFIWRKELKSRSRRKRSDAEGSGLEEDYDYGEDDEEQTPELVTVLPTSHAHRHHHGVSEQEENASSVSTSSASSLPANKLDEEIEESVSKLESVISKTIENTKNIKDPVLSVDDEVEDVEEVELPQLGVPAAPVIVEAENELGNELELKPSIEQQLEQELPLTTTATTGSSSSSSFMATVNVAAEDAADNNNNNQVDTAANAVDVAEHTATSTSQTTTNHNNNNHHMNINNNNLTPATPGTSLPASSSAHPQPSESFSPYDASSTMSQSNIYTSSSPAIVATIETVESSAPSSSSGSNPVAPGIITSTSVSSSTASVIDFDMANTLTTITTTETSLSSASSSTPSSSYPTTSSSSSSSTTIATMPTTTTTTTTQSQTPKTNANVLEPSTWLTTTDVADADADGDVVATTTPRTTLAEIELLELATTTHSTLSISPKAADAVDALEAASNSSVPNLASNELATAATTRQPQQEPVSTSTEASTDYVEPRQENTVPIIKMRLQKLAVTSGKAFSFIVPEETFFDAEDQTNLRLELTDKDGHELKPTSWLQFNADKRELYGIPLDDTVSRWQYRLSATDSGNSSVTETVEISVQQHRAVRTINHEISIAVRINEKHGNNIDWQLKLIRAVAHTLEDGGSSALVVREVRQTLQEPQSAVFVYFNETLPTSECPEAELNELVRRLDEQRLNDLLQPLLSIKSITGQLIGTCQKTELTKIKPTTHMAKNLPPMPRNQVDRVNASVGQLLVYKVPSDTFYDPNDNELTLSLKTKDHKELGTRYWLQFDSKNQEFYGIPKGGDLGSEEYLLVAEDSGGLTANDALVVVVNNMPKREYAILYKAYLAIRHENFNAELQRKFVERIAKLHGDANTNQIVVRSITTHHDSDGTIVNFYNASLYKTHNRCPDAEMAATRSIYLSSDMMPSASVKKALGPELNLTNFTVVPSAACHHSENSDITQHEYIPPRNKEPSLKPSFPQEYLATFILPAVIIVVMVLLASIIACCLHRRRHKSGKMELGDEEERKSFRTKGIPVIFQDEFEEKPEIGNKSPVILKDEKPPLLPPSYNTSNMNGDNDVDEYVPPPAVVLGGREVRGKSPATPSYRKPPPYVSP
ncbi:uncharacterized protein LOC108654291 isoform X2 [Drosophila navojoa]|uniref:uncharacterized protein LOC108654291 isoform X2 n=1 Tax=Drosophila navojoa TaxID=7232 RepID=UPI0008470305|nr:uncharacterized protein LOC108654291 isoform X2 [Drosophila navojoa]